MRRSQLEHAIRTACQIIGYPAVIVVGSQAILGTYDDHELPWAATMSIEVDILPVASDNREVARLADAIEGVAGEWSPIEEQHGFSIDGVDLETAVLPDGWRDIASPSFAGLNEDRTEPAETCAARSFSNRTSNQIPATGRIDTTWPDGRRRRAGR